MTDKPEAPKAQAAEDHDTSHNLLQCVHKFDPSTVKGFGPWDTTTVTKQGISEKDFLLFKSTDKTNGTTAYNANIDGKGYFDLIQPPGTRVPGADTVMSTDVPMGKTLPAIKEGTPEWSQVVNAIHYKVDYESCKEKPAMIVEKGEGYYQTVKRVNPEFSNEEASLAAHHIKHAMGGKSVLKVGEEIKE